jgi:hypothetical protein
MGFASTVVASVVAAMGDSREVTAELTAAIRLTRVTEPFSCSAGLLECPRPKNASAGAL